MLQYAFDSLQVLRHVLLSFVAMQLHCFLMLFTTAHLLTESQFDSHQQVTVYSN